MNAGCAAKTVRSLENACHLSALEVWSRQGAIQIHVYLYLTTLQLCAESMKTSVSTTLCRRSSAAQFERSIPGLSVVFRRFAPQATWWWWWWWWYYNDQASATVHVFIFKITAIATVQYNTKYDVLCIHSVLNNFFDIL